MITLLAQMLYTLKVLCAYKMNDPAIQSVYQAVIVSKMYSTARLCGRVLSVSVIDSEHKHLSVATILCREANDNFFNSILNNSLHVLQNILPSASRDYDTI